MSVRRQIGGIHRCCHFLERAEQDAEVQRADDFEIAFRYIPGRTVVQARPFLDPSK